MTGDNWFQTGHSGLLGEIHVCDPPGLLPFLALSPFGKYVALRHLLKLSDGDVNELGLKNL